MAEPRGMAQVAAMVSAALVLPLKAWGVRSMMYAPMVALIRGMLSPQRKAKLTAAAVLAVGPERRAGRPSAA